MPLAFTLYLILFAVYRGRNQIDRWIELQIKERRRKILSKEEITLSWLNHLLRTVQSGSTLTEGLESFAKLQPDNPYARNANSILSGKSSNDPLSQFVAENIRNGGPISEHLRFFRRQLEQRVRSMRHANAATAQARLQAVVLFLAPWGLLASLAISDTELASAAVISPFCWTLWTLALCLSTSGIFWIERIAVSTIKPKAEAYVSEVMLPNFLIGFYARIASGSPVPEAVEAAIPVDAPVEFRTTFSDITEQRESPTFLCEIRTAIHSAAVRGSPIKEEVQRILADCENQAETRMEEALQKLPVKILAPLFLCVLPAALVILFSFLFPALVPL